MDEPYKDLVDFTVEQGMNALAITDHGACTV
jgi:predicted metal-dependent phosphoesterase TrpH